MKKRLKELWIKALESGYNQADGTLKTIRDDVVQHCCLGVLCEVIAKDTAPSSVQLAKRIVIRPDNINILNYEGEFDSTSVLDCILDELGMDEEVQSALMAANDEGTSFAEIADIIRKSGTLASYRTFANKDWNRLTPDPDAEEDNDER